MLWEERRVFTVSELSKVEQGANVWFLFGSQGTWHTKCFYKEKKKGRFGSEFSEVSWFPFGCFVAVAFFRQLPISKKSLELIRVTPPFQQRMPLQENGEPACHARNTRQVPGVARLGGLHEMTASVRFSANFIFSWAGNSRHWRIGWKYVLLCSHLQVVCWQLLRVARVQWSVHFGKDLGPGQWIIPHLSYMYWRSRSKEINT